MLDMSFSATWIWVVICSVLQLTTTSRSLSREDIILNFDLILDVFNLLIILELLLILIDLQCIRFDWLLKTDN